MKIKDFLVLILLTGCASQHPTFSKLDCPDAGLEGAKAAGFCAKSYALKVCSQYTETLSVNDERRYEEFKKCTTAAGEFLNPFHP